MRNTAARTNVIDLETFRKQRSARAGREAMPMATALFVPVWYCWVPVWAPAVG